MSLMSVSLHYKRVVSRVWLMIKISPSVLILNNVKGSHCTCMLVCTKAIVQIPSLTPSPSRGVTGIYISGLCSFR